VLKEWGNHKITHTYEELPLGAEVAISGIDFICRVVGKEEGRLKLEFDWWYDHEFPVRVEAPYDAYQ
jgi:hypothetical protein